MERSFSGGSSLNFAVNLHLQVLDFHWMPVEDAQKIRDSGTSFLLSTRSQTNLWFLAGMFQGSTAVQGEVFSRHVPRFPSSCERRVLIGPEEFPPVLQLWSVEKSGKLFLCCLCSADKLKCLFEKYGHILELHV